MDFEGADGTGAGVAETDEAGAGVDKIDETDAGVAGTDETDNGVAGTDEEGCADVDEIGDLVLTGGARTVLASLGSLNREFLEKYQQNLEDLLNTVNVQFRFTCLNSAVSTHMYIRTE